LFAFSTRYICHIRLIRPVAFASVFLLAGWFMTHQLDVADGRDIVARWCALAEQRLEYLTELFETGRWRRFHSEGAFLENIQEARAAVETWRDLSSREASRDNRDIDMSWLGHAVAALSREAGRRSQVYPPCPAEISNTAAPENSTISEAGPVRAEEASSAQATGEEAVELTQDLAPIAERYPLLRNRL
jgi:uncharacterized repeat protein (TIGR03809 family)